MNCYCGAPTDDRTGTCPTHRVPSALDRATDANPLGKDETGRAVDTIWDWNTYRFVRPFRPNDVQPTKERDDE